MNVDFLICIEVSHQRGMGHLFRMMNFSESLKKFNYSFIFAVNPDEIATRILQENQISFVILDTFSELEIKDKIFKQMVVSYWINDRKDTKYDQVQFFKELDTVLITIDDNGSGADIADLALDCLNFVQLDFLQQKENLGNLIIADEASQKKRPRSWGKLLVSLGGSDTHGVTLSCASLLKEMGEDFSVHVGPHFQHTEELLGICHRDKIIKQPPSLIDVFGKFEALICGGGLTPFEAIANGMPCLVVANEEFEKSVGIFIEKIGCGYYLGHWTDINSEDFQKKFKFYKSNFKVLAENCLKLGLSNRSDEIVVKITQTHKRWQ